MNFEERIINILNEKNAEIAKTIATEVEAYKASLNKSKVDEGSSKPTEKKSKSKTEVEVPKVEPKVEVPKVETKTKTKKSVTIETPEVEKEVESKTKKSSKKTSESKVEVETPKKSKVETSKKADIPVDLSTRKCQYTIKSKTLPRLCEKVCTNGGEINGVYYCSTHFKTASEKIKDSSAKETSKPKPTTTTPAPKCQKIENLKLVKGKVGLYFTLDNGDKIIFKLDNKTPVGIGMIPSGGTEVVNMNEHIKHTLEMNNISFDSTKVETKASSKAKVETKSSSEESGNSESESVEEDKEIQIDNDVEDDEEDDEDGENDVEDDDEDEIEEEDASEEESADDEE